MQPTFANLKERQQAERADYPDHSSTRIHRALSWLQRAEQCGDDHDARFIFLWISFNAAYAQRLSEHETPTERTAFRSFIDLLAGMDDNQSLFQVLLNSADIIRRLMENQYVFNLFWKFPHRESGARGWKNKFSKDQATVNKALREGGTQTVLNHVFPRLYVLRNQLLHGGATWNGSVNRAQVRDGSNLLATIVPIVIQVLMDHPQAFDTPLTYPVVTAAAAE